MHHFYGKFRKGFHANLIIIILDYFETNTRIPLCRAGEPLRKREECQAARIGMNLKNKWRDESMPAREPTPMAKRQKAWARLKRLQLLQALGGKCARCNTTDHLEMDCIKPCGDDHHRMSSDRRASFYLLQHKQANLQILCTRCNNLKSASDRLVINGCEVIMNPDWSVE